MEVDHVELLVHVSLRNCHFWITNTSPAWSTSRSIGVGAGVTSREIPSNLVHREAKELMSY